MWLHKPPVNQAIYQLKYHNQRYVAKYFAQEICIKYAEEIRRWRPQALVPVPLHRKKAQEAWLQPGGASGRRDRENTWDSGRCESGKTGSLHWLSEKSWIP